MWSPFLGTFTTAAANSLTLVEAAVSRKEDSAASVIFFCTVCSRIRFFINIEKISFFVVFLLLNCLNWENYINSLRYTPLKIRSNGFRASYIHCVQYLMIYKCILSYSVVVTETTHNTSFFNKRRNGRNIWSVLPNVDRCAAAALLFGASGAVVLLSTFWF
jgi:hypothetical protein